MTHPGEPVGAGPDPLEQSVEWRAGVRTVLHAAASTGAAQLCLMEQWSEPGAGAPTHTHFEVEEAILVVEGVAEFWSDGERRRVAAGESILLPPFSRHGFRNAGDGVLHTVAVFAAAAPPVEYENEPGIVYEIGGTGEARRDAHRALRQPES
jgi:quercetin dioxygenase-like cupin family protein